MSVLKFPRFELPSRNSRELLPAILCVVLLLAAVLQLVLFAMAGAPETPVVAPARVPVLDTRIVTDYPQILKAPLFSMGRRSIFDPGQPSASIDGIEVIGIGIAGAASTALLKESDGSIVRAQIGRTIGGWKLTAIQPASLAFERNGERRLLTLSAQPAAAQQVTPPGAQTSDPAPDDAGTDDGDSSAGDDNNGGGGTNP